MIHKSSTNGSVLLENLLQWSRSQTGRIAFEPVKLNLLSLVEETFLLLEGGALNKKIPLQNNIDPNTFILADDNMIKTILRNLISNAIKFTDESGCIVLKSEIQGEFVEISVIDTGIGISQELMDQLFKIDVIVTNKGTAQESGTGLGLLLCKDFVERHNGKIYVESQLNKGSCFKFTIPLA